MWLIAIFCWSCEQESIRQTKTETQFKRLVADAQNKRWRIEANGLEDFESCADGFIYIFTKNSTDTSAFYITEPPIDCDGFVAGERDTLMSLRWSLSDTESSLFDDRIFFLQDDDQSEAFRVLTINPESFVIESEADERRLRFIPFP